MVVMYVLVSNEAMHEINDIGTLSDFDDCGDSSRNKAPRKEILFDHRPLRLNDDDYQRVCQIPKKKV